MGKHAGAAVKQGNLVIRLQNGIVLDPTRGNGLKNVSIHPAGHDQLRINNRGGTATVAGQRLAQYESVEVGPGTRVTLNGQNGQVVRG